MILDPRFICCNFVLLFVAANLFAVCMGTTMGWTSAAVRLKGSVLDETTYSWVGATMPLGALVAALPASKAMERWGRRNMLLVLSPIVFLAWLLIIFHQNVRKRANILKKKRLKKTGLAANTQ